MSVGAILNDGVDSLDLLQSTIFPQDLGKDRAQTSWFQEYQIHFSPLL